ncbi:hypothetical protein CBL_09187 [Carabus blaptoides fortunei]
MIDAVCDARSVTGTTLCDARLIGKEHFMTPWSRKAHLSAPVPETKGFASPIRKVRRGSHSSEPSHCHILCTSVPLLPLELATDGDRVFQIHHRCRHTTYNSIYGQISTSTKSSNQERLPLIELTLITLYPYHCHLHDWHENTSSGFISSSWGSKYVLLSQRSASSPATLRPHQSSSLAELHTLGRKTLLVLIFLCLLRSDDPGELLRAQTGTDIAKPCAWVCTRAIPNSTTAAKIQLIQ